MTPVTDNYAPSLKDYQYQQHPTLFVQAFDTLAFAAWLGPASNGFSSPIYFISTPTLLQKAAFQELCASLWPMILTSNTVILHSQTEILIHPGSFISVKLAQLIPSVIN